MIKRKSQKWKDHGPFHTNKPIQVSLPFFSKIGEPPDTILTSSHEDEETLNLPFTPKACLHIPTLKKQNPIVQKTTFAAA